LPKEGLIGAFDIDGFFEEGVMQKLLSVIAMMGSALAPAAQAADLLPLKQGLYVPAKSACKGASNAEIVNYWGGKSSLGSAQAECTISKVTKNGNVFTITDKCADIRGGGAIVGGPTVITITSPTSFSRGGEAYRYCGTARQF
jgi:hypothetical protein